MPDWAESIAGTDPQDATSVLKLSSNVQPLPGGGLIILWSSIAGKTYTISRTRSLGQGFTGVSEVTATGATAGYEDRTALGAGPYFYRIQLQ